MRWRKSIWRTSLLSADLRCQGGFEAAKEFYDALKLVKRLVNLGDAKSLGLPSGFHHPPADVA